MDSVLRELPDDLPEWRRSGRFFALAIALHVAVLAYPLQRFVAKLDLPPPPTIMVRLVAAVSPPTPAAVASAPASQPQAAPKPAPPREPRVSRRPPVIAMPAAAAAATAPSIAPALPAPAVLPAPPAPPPPVLTAARFDASYLQNPRPAYPPVSRRLGEEGKVLLRVRVSAEGRPAAVDLEKSSNFERLDMAARQAVGQWRFVPAKRGDEAVEATVIVPIVFRLDS